MIEIIFENDLVRRNIPCCATCKYRTPINASIPYQCIGCIKGGELTKWEDAGGKENETE